MKVYEIFLEILIMIIYSHNIYHVRFENFFRGEGSEGQLCLPGRGAQRLICGKFAMNLIVFSFEGGGSKPTPPQIRTCIPLTGAMFEAFCTCAYRYQSMLTYKIHTINVLIAMLTCKILSVHICIIYRIKKKPMISLSPEVYCLHKTRQIATIRYVSIYPPLVLYS